jgi:hypothetical protein
MNITEAKRVDNWLAATEGWDNCGRRRNRVAGVAEMCREERRTRRTPESRIDRKLRLDGAQKTLKDRLRAQWKANRRNDIGSQPLLRGVGNSYFPHQGKREMARRARLS